jgi:hypothetical protein
MSRLRPFLQLRNAAVLALLCCLQGRNETNRCHCPSSQGTTAQPLLNMLGYNKLPRVKRDVMMHAAQAIDELAQAQKVGQGQGTVASVALPAYVYADMDPQLPWL